MTVVSKLRQTVRGKILLAVSAIAGAVALPQLVHLIGAFSGVGSMLGELLLPMHFFVLLAGFLAGPAAGAATGALAPLVSFLLSGMPRATVLPFMMIELLGYGLMAGLLCKVRINRFSKLVIAQIVGRAMRAGAVLLAVFAFGSNALPISSIPNMIRTGLIGILLQWCILPLLIARLDEMENNHDL